MADTGKCGDRRGRYDIPAASSPAADATGKGRHEEGAGTVQRDRVGIVELLLSFQNKSAFSSELSMGWVDPWVGLGWVESTIAKVLKI